MTASGSDRRVCAARYLRCVVGGLVWDCVDVFGCGAAVGDIQEVAGAVAGRGEEWLGRGRNRGGWEKG